MRATADSLHFATLECLRNDVVNRRKIRFPWLRTARASPAKCIRAKMRIRPCCRCKLTTRWRLSSRIHLESQAVGRCKRPPRLMVLLQAATNGAGLMARLAEGRAPLPLCRDGDSRKRRRDPEYQRHRRNVSVAFAGVHRLLELFEYLGATNADFHARFTQIPGGLHAPAGD
jgi:hypothetical protein